MGVAVKGERHVQDMRVNLLMIWSRLRWASRSLYRATVISQQFLRRRSQPRCQADNAPRRSSVSGIVSEPASN